MWYIVYIRPALKEHLVRTLKEQGIEHYFPMLHEVLPNADCTDVVTVERPLVSNIAFLRTDRHIGQVIRDPLIVGILGAYPDPLWEENPKERGLHMRRCATVSDKELEMFKRILSTRPEDVKLLDDPIHVFRANQRVRVTEGEFAGLEGYVVRVQRDRKLVVALGPMAIALSRIERRYLEAVDEPDEE